MHPVLPVAISSEAMPDPEPEKYSIDEMMERLRSRGKGDTSKKPQLVTRSDGTQAMRVRKRKRRSHQPHKEEEARRRKRSLGIAAILTILVIAAGLGALAWILYLNSSSYRDDVGGKISQWSGAEVEMSQFRVTPVSIAAGQLALTWPEGFPAARLVVNDVQGDLFFSSHLTGDWRGEQMVARGGGELILRNAPMLPEGAGAGAGGICPFQFGFGATRFNVKFGEANPPALSITNSEVAYHVPEPSLPVGNLTLQGGHTRIGSFGAFVVNFASFQLSPEGVRVGNIQLAPESDPEAEIRLIGDNLPPVLTRGGDSELRLRLKKVPSIVVLGLGLGRIVDGVFETPEADNLSGRCFFDVTDLSKLRIEAPIQTTLSSAVSLRGFPFGEVLARNFGDAKLTQPRFGTEGSGSLKRDARGVTIENLSLISQGSLRVTGTLAESTGGELTGELEIGMPESTVLGSPLGAVRAVFSRSDRGYRWAKVRVSGTVKDPRDDFEEQLRGSVTGAAGSKAAPPDQDEEWEEMTRPDEER